MVILVGLKTTLYDQKTEEMKSQIPKMTVVNIKQFLVVILVGLITTLYDQKTEEMKLSDTKNDGG